MTPDAINAIKTAMEAKGLAPGEVILDGQIHRCETADKPGSLNGWYLAHADAPASAAFGDWRTGESWTFCAKSDRELTAEDRDRLKARIEADKKRRQEEAAKRHAEARETARRNLVASTPAPADHAYLVRKGVAPVGSIRLAGDGRLVLPVLDATGAVMSLQFIAQDGGKLFLPGGKLKGGYFPIPAANGGKDGPLCVCEGYATGATIYVATGATVLVAFNCGNLLAVAEMARAQYSDRQITICADDDHATAGNPGLSKATEAALAVKALLAVPRFTDPASGTDFNDMAASEGMEAVKAALDAAEAPGLDRLPRGFQAKADGIYYRVEDSNGNVDWVWICSSIKVLALTRNGDGQDWGRLIEVVDPDGQVHRWAMPMALLAGSGEEYRRELLSMGLRLASGKSGGPRLHTFLSLCNPRGRMCCVSRIGWHGGRYVLADAVYGSDFGESVLLQAERAENPFRVHGTLAEWQDSIGRACIGNSRLVLSVSAALAAPLLCLAEAESGGLHLVGGSSLGKTTALVVAGSVCGGGGVRGYVLQWRATANGLEGVAAAHCDALLCLDELSQVTAQAAGETAYMLTNGAGKTRASKQGAARKPAEWRVLFLSTGEITLADKIREDGKSRAMAGQLVRVVDIDADAGAGLGLFEDLHGFPDGDTFSRHLKESAKRSYGVALRVFLEKLTAVYDEAMRVVPALIKTFMAEHCPAEADGQVKRVCARFALVAAGGELGAAYDVLPWPKGEATHAAARCFRDWLSLRGGTGAAEVRDGLAQVRAFFQAHGASRFETWGERVDEAKTINRVGFRRKDDLTGDWEYYVPPATFKVEIARGHDAKRLVKELVERGLVIPGHDGQPASGHRIPGQPFTRYYRLAPGIVSEDSDLSKSAVATVAPVASSNDAGSSRNRPATDTVTTVAPDGCNRVGATAATERLQQRLQEKANYSGVATDATAATAENDNPDQNSPRVIDMAPAERNGLWTGPAEVEL
ncbi:DUF927 domain-containing protein [Solidesulfovibrio sp.]